MKISSYLAKEQNELLKKHIQMKLALFLPSKPDIKWQLGKQIGVNHAIVKLHPDLTRMPPPYKIDTLVKVKKQFTDAGYKLYGLESDEFEMSRIKYGLAGRDEDIEKYNQMIRNCGELNIPMICYNFMPTGWYRTKVDREERGGALTTAFNFEDAKNLPIAFNPLGHRMGLHIHIDFIGFLANLLF